MTDRMADDIGWMLKVNGEQIDRKARSEQRFPDKACLEIKYCEKWEDPEDAKKREMVESIEAVYS